MIKQSVLLSRNDMWRLGSRTVSPAYLANDVGPIFLGLVGGSPVSILYMFY
jgi:hypothetical protein